MSARQPTLPIPDDQAAQRFMELPIGTWLVRAENGKRRAFCLVRRRPRSGELVLRGSVAEFATTPDHLLRSGYRPVKRKPRNLQEGL